MTRPCSSNLSGTEPKSYTGSRWMWVSPAERREARWDRPALSVAGAGAVAVAVAVDAAAACPAASAALNATYFPLAAGATVASVMLRVS